MVCVSRGCCIIEWRCIGQPGSARYELVCIGGVEVLQLMGALNSECRGWMGSPQLRKLCVLSVGNGGIHVSMSAIDLSSDVSR